MAGTEPGERVHAEVVQTMLEVGIDLTNVKPRLLTTDLARQATLLVTMGCGDACPFVPGLKKFDWPLLDPKGQSVETVRKIRDDRAREAVRASIAHGESPARVALAVSEALKSHSPRRRYPAGREAKFLSLLKKLGPAQLLDKGIRKQFGLEAA